MTGIEIAKEMGKTEPTLPIILIAGPRVDKELRLVSDNIREILHKPVPKEELRQLVVDIIPDLKKPDLFFYDEGLRITLARQNKEAPLVFLIPSTGVSSLAPNSALNDVPGDHYPRNSCLT
jgi:hypothetical protein